MAVFKHRFVLLFFYFIFFYSSYFFPQQFGTEDKKDLNVLYRNEASTSIFMHSGGFGLNFRRGFHITGESKRMLELEFCNMSDPKEIKISMNQDSRGYYYGKLNSLFILRPGFGWQKVLFRRSERRSVEIRYNTFFGGSICFAKPVFLEILHHTKGNEPIPLTTEQYDPELHNIDNIYGRSNFFVGINRTKLYPGAYSKFSLSCEFGEDYTDIRALETGVVADYYPFPIPVMALNEKKPYFISLYASLILGKKWY